jgi:hypothetical protein
MSNKNNIKENWQWDPDFPKPGTEITFRTAERELTGIVRDVINKHTLIVDAEDGRELEVIELLDGGWMEREEYRAKSVDEWGGAGFSYGGSSMFPKNRGGGITRAGFGGGSNIGGPNMMYTYEIKPLNRLLQPDATYYDDAGTETIHNGHIIEGEELNKKDGIYHVGTVLSTSINDEGNVNYYVIIDEKDSRKIKIDPTSAVLLGGENYVANAQNKQPGRDEEDLERAGQMQETMRAKKVNEVTPQSVENFTWIPNESTIDEFFTWYAGTPEWNGDWQVANVMSVNDKHAQEDGYDGMSHILNLWDAKYEKISIEQEQLRPGDWDLQFKFKGDEYSIQSGTKAFAETDDY